MVPVISMLRLLFPFATPEELLTVAAPFGPAAQVATPSDLRLLLGSVDQVTFASPVEVRIDRSDIVVVEVDGISLALDRHDRAISQPILSGMGHDSWLADIAAEHCRPGMSVIDVGANVGYFTMLAWAAVGAEGRVIAIEPRSENCRLLLLSVGLNQAVSVELLPIAADRERGFAHFGTYIGTNGGLLADNASALLDGRGVVVPTFALDELVNGPVDLIKLDVEGAEGRVIDGARALVAEWRPVVVTELCPAMIESVSGCTCEEYLAFFMELGYRIQEVDPYARSTGPVESVGELMDRWGEHSVIRNLLLTTEVDHPGQTSPID